MQRIVQIIAMTAETTISALLLSTVYLFLVFLTCKDLP